MQEQEAPLLGDSGKRPSTPPLDSRELTVDEGLDLAGFGRWQYGLLTIVGFSVVSGAVETSLLSYLTLCVADEWDLNYAQLTTFTSVVYVGMVLGSIGAGPFADAHGRRATILGFLQARRADLAPPRAREHPGNVDAIRRSLITATPTSVDASARLTRFSSPQLTALFGMLTAASPDFTTLVAFRFFVGLALGAQPVPLDLLAEARDALQSPSSPSKTPPRARM